MNVTDVGHLESDADVGDDKMEVAARREGKSPWEIARYYEAEFLRHTEMMRVLRPTIVCRATEHIDEMIAMVARLVERGHA
jgi:cysteinyl-tRNA synthetase